MLAAVGYVWAFAALTASPHARAHYDRRRAVGDGQPRSAAQPVQPIPEPIAPLPSDRPDIRPRSGLPRPDDHSGGLMADSLRRLGLRQYRDRVSDPAWHPNFDP